MTQERVLIVEDEENERTGLAELVSGWGYRTDTAADGVEALEKIPGFAPAIVITDVKMPRMGGMELVERLSDTTPSIVARLAETASKTSGGRVEENRACVESQGSFFERNKMFIDIQGRFMGVFPKRRVKGAPGLGLFAGTTAGAVRFLSGL